MSQNGNKMNPHPWKYNSRLYPLWVEFEFEFQLESCLEFVILSVFSTNSHLKVVLYYRCSNQWREKQRACLQFFKGEIGQNSLKQWVGDRTLPSIVERNPLYYRAMYTYIVPSFSSPCNTKRLGNAILDWRANVGQFNRDKTSSQSFHVRQPWPKGGSNYSTKRLVIASTN